MQVIFLKWKQSLNGQTCERRLARSFSSNWPRHASLLNRTWDYRLINHALACIRAFVQLFMSLEEASRGVERSSSRASAALNAREIIIWSISGARRSIRSNPLGFVPSRSQNNRRINQTNYRAIEDSITEIVSLPRYGTHCRPVDLSSRPDEGWNRQPWTA